MWKLGRIGYAKTNFEVPKYAKIKILHSYEH